MKKEYTFEKINMGLDEFSALIRENRDDVYFVAAMTVIAYCNYKYDKNLCFDMVNELKNPKDPISVYEKQFASDRLEGKEYKPFSFLHGAIPENGYKPTTPYIISVHYNNNSFEDEGWGKILMHSYGADSYREIKLRQKRSTGEWFLVEQLILADIREPAIGTNDHTADIWG